MFGLYLPYLLLLYTDIRLLDSLQVLFSLSEGGDYLMTRLGKLLSCLLGLLEIKHLVRECNIIDFHLIGGWVAARGGFTHKW